jgi:hypothetical protein
MAVKNFTKSNFDPKGFQFVETIYYTSNATFTKATYPWLRAIRVKCQGAGGGGGGAATTTAGQTAIADAGAAGGYAESFITNIAGLSASVTITVPAGGAGGTAGANNGTGGSNASFGSTVVGNGGGPGGGTAANSNINVVGGATTGGGGTGDFVVQGRRTTNAFTAIGGDFQEFRSMSGGGGDSFLGAGATGRTSNGNGNAGINYGGGGGGAFNAQSQATARSGGAGAPGIVIVELFA